LEKNPRDFCAFYLLTFETRAHEPGARYLEILHNFNNFGPESFVQIDENFFPKIY
jgi:hypothetical protein